MKRRKKKGKDEKKREWVTSPKMKNLNDFTVKAVPPVLSFTANLTN